MVLVQAQVLVNLELKELLLCSSKVSWDLVTAHGPGSLDAQAAWPPSEENLISSWTSPIQFSFGILSVVEYDSARFKTAEGARARLATYVGLSSKRTPEEYRIPVNAAHLQRHVPFLKNSAAKPKKHGELLSLYNDRGADGRVMKIIENN
ncbi:hypothetical protein MJO29_003883 [Puccinia striiformis f. sp. tritici]|nr:hypothetical protein MJO29_003883 [Puccinia striiformis f. sp. tritici]